MKIKALYIWLVLLLTACNNAENKKEASIQTEEGKFFIKLRGERVKLVHSPKDVGKNNTYKDSILIQIPSLYDGTIKGADIQIKEGQYNYQGYITIDRNFLKVNLLIDDTDSKRLRPLSWNGEYILIRE